MTEVGALICEAVLNFEEEEGVTSPESLRRCAGSIEFRWEAGKHRIGALWCPLSHVGPVDLLRHWVGGIEYDTACSMPFLEQDILEAHAEHNLFVSIPYSICIMYTRHLHMPGLQCCSHMPGLQCCSQQNVFFRSVRQQGIAVASEVPKIVFELLGHIYIYKHAILYIYPVENEHGTSKPLVWSLENSL